jgi:uncharacterized protein YlzI (FlbEa/FlbD family)
MIKVTDFNTGEQIWLTPEHIIGLKAPGDGRTAILLSFGLDAHVRETPDEIEHLRRMSLYKDEIARPLQPGEVWADPVPKLGPDDVVVATLGDMAGVEPWNEPGLAKMIDDADAERVRLADEAAFDSPKISEAEAAQDIPAKGKRKKA